MLEIGPVQGHGAFLGTGHQRRPQRQAVLRVHDVEAPPARERRRGLGITAGIESEQLELDLPGAAQRIDLALYEAPERGPLWRRVHVGNDQGAQRWPASVPVRLSVLWVRSNAQVRAADACGTMSPWPRTPASYPWPCSIRASGPDGPERV